ncbi:MAG: hypothetical protein R3257_03645 [bacterium]|nr:hypothetical protein [bacterium]
MIKRNVWIMLSLAVVATMGIGCPSAKKVGSEEIISAVVSAMCKKMAQCQPNAMPSEDFCQNTMKTALQGNKDLPKVETTQKQLNACVASIEKTECEGLLGSKPPEGCEFLQ